MAVKTHEGGLTKGYYWDGVGTLSQYRFVKLAADNKITPITANTDNPIGVALDTTEKTDILVPIGMQGIFPVEAGGAITRGSEITIDASGRAVAASPLAVKAGATPVTSTAANGQILDGGVTPQPVVGRALEAASAAGDIILCKIY